VEEHEVARSGEATSVEQDAVENILAKRGYVEEKHVEEEVEEAFTTEKLEPVVAAAEEISVAVNEEGAVDEEGAAAAKEETLASVAFDSVEPHKETPEASLVPHTDPSKEADSEAGKVSPEMPRVPTAAEPDEELMEEVLLESEHKADDGKEDVEETPAPKIEDPEPITETSHANVQSEPTEAKPLPAPVKPPVAQVASAPPTATISPQQAPSSLETEYKRALAEAREAHKECRTLRRHVVSLNSELESAEAEIQAQRTELERAAERMEKDRSRQKEEKDRLVTRHADELKALRLQQEQTISEIKARADQQVEEARARMKEIEQRRMQEGGDWTKEMENALHREQESVRRMANLE